MQERLINRMNENNFSTSKTSYSEIFSSTSKYSILRIILFAISYIFYIFITRLLGPEEFGKLALVIQIGTEIGTLLVIGLPVALNKFISGFNGQKEKSIIFTKSLNISLLVFLGFSIIYFPVFYFFKDSLPAEIVEARYWLFAFILSMGLFKLNIGMLSGTGRFISGAIFDGTIQIIWRLISFILIFIFAYKQFITAFSVNVMVQMVVLIVLFILLRQYFVSAGIKLDSAILKFSIVALVSQVIFSLISVIDPLLIRLILKDASQVGYFYTGIRIPFLFQTLFFAPLAIPFIYYFSRADTSFEVKSNVIRFGTRMLAIIFSFISFLLFILSEKIILLLFGDAFSGSIIILKIFAFSMFFIALDVFSQPFFFSINKPFIPVYLGLGYLVIVVPLDFILIPYFKSTGPAIAAVIGLFFRVFAYFIILKKYKINLIKTFFILIGIITCSVCVDVFILSYSGIAIFVGLIFLTRIITIKDIKDMTGIIRRRNN